MSALVTSRGSQGSAFRTEPKNPVRIHGTEHKAVVVARLGAGHVVPDDPFLSIFVAMGQELGILTIPRQVAYVKAG
jgi:hypothetical protein